MSLTGPAIRAARLAAGLTQEAAAERHGVSQPQWSDWERGVRTPGVDQLAAIAATLGCELRIELRSQDR